MLFRSMNDIAQKATADKFLSALKKEGLSKHEAGSIIGLMSEQVSYLFNEKYWSRLGNPCWDKVLAWVNSGQSLREYSENHGKVLQEKKHSEVAKDEIDALRKNLSNYKQEDVIKDEPQVKVKPEALERRQAELAERNPPLEKRSEQKEKLTLIILLKERRDSLLKEINAIDRKSVV